jgi:hypothetical protein
LVTAPLDIHAKGCVDRQSRRCRLAFLAASVDAAGVEFSPILYIIGLGYPLILYEITVDVPALIFAPERPACPPSPHDSLATYAYADEGSNLRI